MEKSAAIRGILAKKPSLTPKEVQSELATKGIEVSRNLCKVVCHRERKSDGAQRSTERELRGGEVRVGGVITRLSEEDYAVWERMLTYVDSLNDKSRDRELHALSGEPLRRLPEVRNWLSAVSTWRARNRRHRILQQFISDLSVKYPTKRQPKWKNNSNG